jgi:putative membrane protein
MHRRIMLAALGAAFATPVLAQTMQPSGQGGATGPAQGATGQNLDQSLNRAAQSGQAAMPMGRAEMEHVERTMKLGAAALATSRVALEKAENPRVKMFAQFEAAEQETIADILKAMKEQDMTVTGSVDRPSQNDVRAMLDDEGRRMLEQLQSAQRGTAFDRDYVQGQIQGHRELLDAQEDYIRQGRNREHVSVAKLARGQIKEHIALLEMMQGELGRRG